jgi:hypothetical protein
MAERNTGPNRPNKRVLSVAPPGPTTGGSTLYDNEDAPTQFCDGVGQMHVGGSVSKLRFFNVKSVDEQSGVTSETREISLVVVMPTPALFEWIAAVASSIPQSLPTLERGYQASVAAISSMNESKKNGK